MFKFKSIAKVRISEDNTKQKNTFLFLLSSERMQSHTLNLQVKELSTKSKIHNSTDITKYKYKIIFYSFGENTLDTPTAIHPVEQLLSPENGCIPLDVPSYSLNIVRIK